MKERALPFEGQGPIFLDVFMRRVASPGSRFGRSVRLPPPRSEGILMEGFQFIDIIILAMVAGFIVLRLRSVLGRREGLDPRTAPKPETFDRGQDRPGDKV